MDRKASVYWNQFLHYHYIFKNNFRFCLAGLKMLTIQLLWPSVTDLTADFAILSVSERCHIIAST